MNAQLRAQAVDDVATRDPERLGYGYADTQHPWHHDPAFDLARATVLELIEAVHATTGRAGVVLQVGLEARPGLPLALAAEAHRVVVVDPRGDRVAALREVAGRCEFTGVIGDPCDPEVAARVVAAAGECDVLLLADADSYETARAPWEHFAGSVRVGGLVAIADRSQTFAADRRPFDVDRFVLDLGRDVLAPCGVRPSRLGDASAVHVYVQTATTRGAAAPPWPIGWRPTRRPVALGAVHDHSLHAWRGGVIAVPGATTVLCPRHLEQNRYPLVLAASDRPGAERLVAAWLAAAPALAAARAALRTGDVGAARSLVVGVDQQDPWLRDALVASLETAPWNRELQVAQGTLALFTGREREGAALLRRALSQEMVDAELMQTVAAAYLRVLDDEVAARELLGEGRHRVRVHKVARVCQERLRGSVLWQHPKLVAEIRGVVQVGRHGDDPAAWTALEIADQVLLDGAPELDDLVATGRLDPTRYDLLCIDADGAELDVLRGSGAVLRHVDTVCTTVFLQPARTRAPMPQEIQSYLREFDGGDGFALRAFEPGSDPARGTALFRRLKRRRGRR